MASAKTSPIITAAQQNAIPRFANLPIRRKITEILIICSSIWVAEPGVAFLLDMKYPRIQEETAIKGREKGSILRAKTALSSAIRLSAIISAPKKTILKEITAKIRLIVIALFKILSVPFLEPRANSSAQSFVTAVEIPEVAKVEIKT